MTLLVIAGVIVVAWLFIRNVAEVNFGRDAWAQTSRSTADPGFPDDNYNLNPVGVTVAYTLFPFVSIMVWGAYHQIAVAGAPWYLAVWQGFVAALVFAGVPGLIMLVTGWLTPVLLVTGVSFVFWVILMCKCAGCACAKSDFWRI